MEAGGPTIHKEGNTTPLQQPHFPHLLPRDRKFLRIPLITILNYPPPSKQNLWFQAVQAALARKRISEERSLRRAYLNDIRRYFQPKTMSS